MWTQQLKAIKVTDKQHRKQNDTLAIEKETNLLCDGAAQHTFHHYPGKEKEMAAGYLIATGKCTPNDIQDITIREDGIIATFSSSSPKETPISFNEKLEWQSIFQLTAYLQEKALLFKDTAVTESAGIGSGNELLCFSEDLHQNNAFYKVLGERLKTTTDLSQDVLLLSSKIDSVTMKQIIHIGLPIVISRVAPTSAALQLALDHDITVLGFARGKKFTVYSHPKKITLPS